MAASICSIAPSPQFDKTGSANSGAEIGIVARLREHGVQFTQALADVGGECLIASERVLFGRGLVTFGQRRRWWRPPRSGGRGNRGSTPSHRPGFARSPAPARPCAACLRRPRGRVRRTTVRYWRSRAPLAGAFISPSGVDAGQHAADQLQHQRVAHDPGRIALFGREAADLRIGRELDRLASATWAGTAARHRPNVMTRLSWKPSIMPRVSASMAKASVREADAGTFAQPGHGEFAARRRRWSPLPRRGRAAVRSFSVRSADRCRDLGEQNAPFGTRQHDRVGKVDGADAVALGGEPPPLRQIGRQRLALDHLAAFPPAAHPPARRRRAGRASSVRAAARMVARARSEAGRLRRA